MNISYQIGDSVEIEEFMKLAALSWKKEFSSDKKKLFEVAITKTLNITARSDNETRELVGCVRILTDGYFSTIPEIMVHPHFQKLGIGKKLMQLAAQSAPGSPSLSSLFIPLLSSFSPPLSSFLPLPLLSLLS